MIFLEIAEQVRSNENLRKSNIGVGNGKSERKEEKPTISRKFKPPASKYFGLYGGSLAVLG